MLFKLRQDAEAAMARTVKPTCRGCDQGWPKREGVHVGYSTPNRSAPDEIPCPWYQYRRLLPSDAEARLARAALALADLWPVLDAWQAAKQADETDCQAETIATLCKHDDRLDAAWRKARAALSATDAKEGA